MSGYSAFDFPVLQPDGDDFDGEVKYTVEAESTGKHITITHRLTGQSFLREWLLEDKAAFSVQLLYKNSAERQAHPSASKIKKENDSLICIQRLTMDFSYPPKITPCIVVCEDCQINPGKSGTGLNDIWLADPKEPLSVSAWSRIAHHAPLDFIDGKTQNLIAVDLDRDLGQGEMKVVPREYALENEAPVILKCSKDIYHELKKPMATDTDNIKTDREALSSAVVTHSLSVVYAEMNRKYISNENQISFADMNETLKAHLEMMQEKTGFDLGGENFDACLAATKMRRYAIQGTEESGEDDE